LQLYSEKQEDATEWVNAIQSACEAFMEKSIGTSEAHKPKLETMTKENREIIEVLEIEGNKTCADCGILRTINLQLMM
jgi:hypothetical protein